MADSRRVGGNLGPQDVFVLDQWGRQLYEAFGQDCYLVGSAARGEPYRDVDVRMCQPPDLMLSPLLRRTLNVALTVWGRQLTRLPLDFQIQPPDEFHSHDGEVRNPMGPRSMTQWQGIP